MSLPGDAASSRGLVVGELFIEAGSVNTPQLAEVEGSICAAFAWFLHTTCVDSPSATACPTGEHPIEQWSVWHRSFTDGIMKGFQDPGCWGPAARLIYLIDEMSDIHPSFSCCQQ